MKAKVDDYFARCRLAAFDARALGALNREETEYLNILAKDLRITASEVAGFPLARIEAGKPLPLTATVNPAWESAVTALAALFPGKTAITEADWTALTGKLAVYTGWAAAKTGARSKNCGIARIREILAGNTKATITALIAKDKALEPEANAIVNVERLIRYHRDLALLLTNFVNFADFYNRGKPAIFQAGTLYLDERSCDLTLPVEDAGKHGAMAGMAGAYLAYCDCVRKATGEKRQIVAAFTNGDSDNLMIGRNGIFYDRQGRDWDATITKIIDNPISIRQAFWSPYKKLVRMIEEQVAKRAAAAEAASDSKLAATAGGVAQADKPKPEPKKIDVGAVAALGVAFGAIGTALAYVLGMFKGLPVWQLPLAIAGIMVLISTPSMVLAYIKLRKRNLGPILDANGWAVNAKAKINVPFGAALTGIAKLPPGAQRDLIDPYAESKKGRNRTIMVAVLVAIVWSMWYFGCIEHYLPNLLPKSGYLERKEERLEKERLKKVEAEKPPAAAPVANPPGRRQSNQEQG